MYPDDVGCFFHANIWRHTSLRYNNMFIIDVEFHGFGSRLVPPSTDKMSLFQKEFQALFDGKLRKVWILDARMHG